MKTKRPLPPANTCIIYCRVSTDPQEREGTSLTTQEQGCRTYADRQGWTVVEAITDTASGYSLDRRGLSRVRDLLREARADRLLVYAVDRLSRHQTQMSVLIDEMQRERVTLECVTEEFSNTTIGRMVASLLAGIAELEREKIVERTIRGKQGKLRTGVLLGPREPLYGYRFDAATGRRVINEDEAAFVREAFRLCAEEHQGARLIGKNLTAAGFRTRSGTVWDFSSIWRMLRHEAYKGETIAWRTDSKHPEGKRRRPADQTIRLPEGVTPAIVSPAMWEAVQAFLTRNHGERTRNAARPYLLRGLAWCGTCGLKLYVITSNRGALPRYSCASHNRSAHWCGGKSLQVPLMETAVMDALIALLRTPDLIHAAIQTWRESLPQQQQADVERMRAQLRQTEQRQSRLVRAMIDAEGVAARTFQTELKRLEDERAALDTALMESEEIAAQHERALAIQADSAALCRQWDGNLEQLDFERERLLLESLALRVTLTDSEILVDGQLPYEAEEGIVVSRHSTAALPNDPLPLPLSVPFALRIPRPTKKAA